MTLTQMPPMMPGERPLVVVFVIVWAGRGAEEGDEGGGLEVLVENVDIVMRYIVDDVTPRVAVAEVGA